MNELMRTIEAFNRKERFFLFSYATGNNDRGLTLSSEFRSRLGKEIGLTVPPEARGYLDYHIDWLHAAVLLARDPDSGLNRPNWEPGTQEPELKPTIPWVSTGSQEDIDLVVAFERDGVTWLVLIEAKAETNWTNKQVRSKAERLRHIFGGGELDPASRIQPVFCLMSPRRPGRLAPIDGEQWPAWMLRPPTTLGAKPDFAWLKLPVPLGRKKVTGSTADGKPSKNRKYWTVTDVRGSEALVE